MKKHLLVSLSAGFQDARVGESLGIRYIEAYLSENRYEVDIIENQFQNLNDSELAEIIGKYDVIGFSINYCGQVMGLKKLLSHIDATNRIVYLGGHFASICYESLLRDFAEISFVILADGELATLELVKNNFHFVNTPNIAFLNKDKIVVCNRIFIVDDLDSLPFPYRNKHSYFMGDNHFSIITSRGCYHNCSYCSVSSFTKTYFHNKLRLRSAQNIYNEIKYLHTNWGVQYITFQDDLFIGTDKKSIDRAKLLASLLIDDNDVNIFFSIQCSVKAIDFDVFSLLHKAGLRNVMIGIENFSAHAQICFNKQQSIEIVENALSVLNVIGIPISYGFIMYYPEMISGEILDNLEILYRLNLLNIRAITSMLQIYIGTDYSKRELDAYVSLERDNYSIKYQFRDPALCDFISECRLFKKTYGYIENQIYHLAFLSHSNPQVSIVAVEVLHARFRSYLYNSVKAKYSQIFLNDFSLDIDNLDQQMDSLYSDIVYLGSLS